MQREKSSMKTGGYTVVATICNRGNVSEERVESGKDGSVSINIIRNNHKSVKQKVYKNTTKICLR